VAPLAGLAGHDQVGLPQIGQMARDSRLWGSQDFHNVSDAKLSFLQDTENPQPCSVGERSEHQVDAADHFGLSGVGHVWRQKRGSSNALSKIVRQLAASIYYRLPRGSVKYRVARSRELPCQRHTVQGAGTAGLPRKHSGARQPPISTIGKEAGGHLVEEESRPWPGCSGWDGPRGARGRGEHSCFARLLGTAKAMPR